MKNLQCDICGSQNILKNKILNKYLCGYCFLNFNDNELDNAEKDFKRNFELLKNLLPEIKGYKNPILITDNYLIKSYYNIQSFDQKEISKKNLSKLLVNGKIDCLIIPDTSNFLLKYLIEIKELFSDSIDIYIGIFSPDYVFKNANDFVLSKYIYSLLSLSKFALLNNLDIFDIKTNMDYIILNIKTQQFKNEHISAKLQDLWEQHEISQLFKAIDFII